ncbi:lipopolysaccharide biosynthesis protein [Pelagibacterium xiamenense]|uniref:lipopolysaccharide biosynthesis protein n=1 Tax=Pelagibacterium xiamenense TaxID=2901140 RepID=UPI001E60851A|nr:oligosaccharide flippase family protein [Pelagibacterium xiamenense]MCD7059661.1 oligosaccharide flippase family protein [Pelagibacterium xiamenense]
MFRLAQFGLMHIWPALVLVVAAIALPPADTGAVAVIMSIATLFRPLVGFSLGRASIRYIGHARGLDANAQEYASLAFSVALVLSMPALAILAVAIGYSTVVYDMQAGSSTVIAAVVFSYLYGLTEFLDGLYRAENKFQPLAVALIVSRLVAFGLFFGLTLAPRLDVLLGVLALSEVVCVLMLGTAFVRSHRLTPVTMIRVIRAHRDETIELLRYAVPVVINALAVYLYARAMVLIVGLFVPPAEVGGFELAVQLTNLPMAFTIVVATVISPKAAEMFVGATRERQSLRVLLSQGASFALWLNTLAAAFLLLVGPVALAWLVPDLPAAAIVLIILSPLVAVKAFAQILSGEISVAVGRAGTTARITLVFGVLNVIAGLTGGYLYGVVGGAIAMVLVHTAAAAVSVWLLSRQTDLFLRYRAGAVASGVAIGSLPAVVLVLMARDIPALAVIGGTMLLLAGNLVVLLVSARFRLPFHKPLVDGFRMLLPPRPKYSLLRDLPAEPDLSGHPVVVSSLAYLEAAHPGLDRFWKGTANTPVADWSFLAHADYVYAKWLLGRESELSPKAAEAFADAVGKAKLAGSTAPGKQMLPHLTAYTLGALNILAAAGYDMREQVYADLELDLDRLIDAETKLPKWPAAWSHHAWRVSHWLGGIPAILLNFARFDPKKQVDERLVHDVLEACDAKILSPETGLMRTYRSDAVQSAFRAAYRLRHRPELADVGGLVHIHWVNYALGRDYRAVRTLLQSTTTHMLEHYPFLEGSPYCLDFDYVQLQRTALEQDSQYDACALIRRNDVLITDLVRYLSSIRQTYKLHRLPGALAALHEATMIAGHAVVPGIGTPPRDVIKTALWL